jgi:hypothetical protein
MKCKRCECTDEKPCLIEIHDGTGRAVPCSWVVTELCSACLTQDEQAIIATFVEQSTQELRAPSIEERRQELRNVLFARIYPVLIDKEYNGNRTTDRIVEASMEFAELGAKRMLPDPPAPTGIELASNLPAEFFDPHLGQGRR